MSVEFSNAYQEILLDNLMAIIKQNFVFQTQIKLTENFGKEKSELEDANKRLQNQLETLANQIRDAETYKMKAEQNTSAHEEKSRIQTALNDTMKKLSGLTKELEEKKEEVKIVAEQKQKEIDELKDYIKVLEENVAQSKLKKINPSYKPPEPVVVKTLDVPVDPVDSTITSYIENTTDGSSF